MPLSLVLQCLQLHLICKRLFAGQNFLPLEVLSSYIPLFGVFQGTNHAALPMVTATCALSTRVAVTYLFRYSPFLGHTIIWWNGIFGFGVGFVITWSYYLSGRWTKNVTEPQ